MPRRDTRRDWPGALEELADAGALWCAVARDPRRGYCSGKKRLTRRPLVPALIVAESPPDPDDDDGARRDLAWLKAQRAPRAPKRPGKYTLFGWAAKADPQPLARVRFRVRRARRGPRTSG